MLLLLCRFRRSVGYTQRKGAVPVGICNENESGRKRSDFKAFEVERNALDGGGLGEDSARGDGDVLSVECRVVGAERVRSYRPLKVRHSGRS